MRVRLIFAECENAGDLHWYAEAVTASGGTVEHTYLDPQEYESGVVVATIGDMKDFRSRFRVTKQAAFCQGYTTE